jgi:exodeoxyribonuclease VII large subunit
MADLLIDRPAGGVWSVGALVAAVAALLEHGFASCTVAGEISGFSRATSGHCYFTLKDPASGASLRCAMFRRAASLLDFLPSDGQSVDVRGRLAVYEQRGELQFIVEAMQQGGAGALYERFLRLKASLGAEGLFDASAKRVLPAHPQSIGVVTSLGGAVLHDVATTLARRSPHIGVVVYPSVVQGPDAPAALCEAMALAGRRSEVDVLIICRGGGSLEDLWAFNDERVVRAIRALPMPVVSGVGHETDVTLADLAADLRAPTPTAAAELGAPATAQLTQALDAIKTAIGRRTVAAIDVQAQRIDRLALRLARPGEGVRRRSHRLDLLAQRLATLPKRALESRRARCEAAAARMRHALAMASARLAHRLDGAALRLQALDPQRVLARGYALLSDDAGRPLTSVARLMVGASVSARLQDGSATLIATSVAADPAEP